MKRHMLILAGVVLLAMTLAGTVSAQVPALPDSANGPGWWGTATDAYFYGYWDATGAPSQTDCDYTITGTECDCDTLTHELTYTTVGSDTLVTLSLGNCAYTYIKHVFIFIEGTGATPSVGDFDFDAEAGSDWGAVEMSAEGDGTDWWIRISANIYPQPAWETFEFTIVGGGTVAKCWAGTHCEEHTVPTLSEWGLIIFSLLILTLVTVVMTRRKRATAAA